MATKPWKVHDPLYRGDATTAVTVPDATAKTGVVEHILYLGGAGRPTPFTSTTESAEVAEHFAGPDGQVWETDAAGAASEGARHLARKQLLQDLRGFGKGRAKWHDAWEVAQAAALVVQWAEHLLDWKGSAPDSLPARVAETFSKRSPKKASKRS